MWWKTLLLPLAIVGILFGLGEAQKASVPSVRPVPAAVSARGNDARLAQFLSRYPGCQNPPTAAAASACRGTYCNSFNPRDPLCGGKVAFDSGTGSAPPPPPSGDSGGAFQSPTPQPPPPSGSTQPQQPPPPGAQPGQYPGQQGSTGAYPPPPGTQPGIYPGAQGPTGGYQPPPGSQPGQYPGQQGPTGGYPPPPGSQPGVPPGGQFERPSYGQYGPPPGMFPGQVPGQNQGDQYGPYGRPPEGSGYGGGEQQQMMHHFLDLPSDLAGKCDNPESCKTYCLDVSHSEPSCQQAQKYLKIKDEAARNREQGQSGNNGEGFQGANEQQQQQMNDQCKKEVARGADQLSRMLSGIERKLAAMEKRGLNVSAARDLQTQLQALVESMKNAEDCSELSDIGPQIGDLMGQLQQALQGIERLSQAARIFKQFDSQLKRESSRFARLAAKLQRSGTAIDTSKASALRDQVAACLEQARAQAAGGDEQAFDSLQECQDNLEDLKAQDNVLESLSNLRSQTLRIKRDIANGKRDLTIAARRGGDVSAATAALAEAENAFKDLTTAAAGRDLDKIADVLQTIEGALTTFHNEIDDLLGNKAFEFKSEFGELQTPKSLDDFVAKPPSFLVQ